MKFTSLASLKRAIATPGIVVRVVAHWQPQLIGTTRTPTKVQGNGYWFNGPDNTGKVVRMWAETPKASELRFNEDGTVTYHPTEPDHSWTLAFDLPPIDYRENDLSPAERLYDSGRRFP